jgi:hypothetical protein
VMASIGEGGNELDEPRKILGIGICAGAYLLGVMFERFNHLKNQLVLGHEHFDSFHQKSPFDLAVAAARSTAFSFPAWFHPRGVAESHCSDRPRKVFSDSLPRPVKRARIFVITAVCTQDALAVQVQIPVDRGRHGVDGQSVVRAGKSVAAARALCGRNQSGVSQRV